MTDPDQIMLARIRQRFGARLTASQQALGEITIEVAPESLIEVCRALRDEDDFHFEQLMDLCGVDYSEYREDTRGTTGLAAEDVVDYPDHPLEPWHGPRFAVVYHLLSIRHNRRLRLRVFTAPDFPVVDSVIDIWAAANWFEREAFDLFGIMFEGHPDLRRLLTDYGFIGHPFRKDFPLIGNVEMRYDPDKQRVVYQPVTIENRIMVPRVIRRDHRYVVEETNHGNS